MRNCVDDLLIFCWFGLSDRPSKAPVIRSVVWSPSAPGWIKVNTDGAGLGSPGVGGYGGVFGLVDLLLRPVSRSPLLRSIRSDQVTWRVRQAWQRCIHQISHMEFQVSHLFREEEFNDCLQSSELVDLRFSGFLHTWCNKRSNGCISKKLDRVLVNNDWLAKFQNSEVIFLPPSISDHCPSVVKLGLQGIKKNCPFKIFNFLTARSEFLPLVEKCWQEQVHGIMQYKLCSKLRNLKKVLKALNNDKVGDLTIKSIEAKATLDECQRLLDLQSLDSNLRIWEKDLISCYTSTLKAEEDLLRQKSTIQWLKAGDRTQESKIKNPMTQELKSDHHETSEHFLTLKMLGIFSSLQDQQFWLLKI
ncbi:hypothetical protein Dsin_018624 [Dipteronia sinensis]|uniref:Reverse transcriptase n=1 Tax=Dipteronia sinensis TaxID=43782 RepID=A0AAE0A770_9ROSI|nr:hypothetical protein Dsin_018624 [Dipteronia sinensis]